MVYPRVLCLGEILFDLLAEQVGYPLEKVRDWKAYPGGAPANVACGLVKLGTPAAFIGCVGEDGAGKELVSMLETLGVNIEGIQYHATAPTRQVYVTRSLTGERHFAGFGQIPTNQFADTYLEAEKLPETLFAQADYLVIGTLALAYPESRQGIWRALKLAQQHQVKIFLDINHRPVFWQNLDEAYPLIDQMLSEVDFLKCSLEEAQELFKTDNPQTLTQRYPNLALVLMTAGAGGCAYQIGQNTGQIPAFMVDVIDTTGAGDAFVAGFLHKYGVLDDYEVIRYANAVGALTTTQAGAIFALPTSEQVESFLASHV